MVSKKIPIKGGLLHVGIGMNDLWYYFDLDLKKGKALIAGYKYFRVGWSIWKQLNIRQTVDIYIL